MCKLLKTLALVFILTLVGCGSGGGARLVSGSAPTPSPSPTPLPSPTTTPTPTITSVAASCNPSTLPEGGVGQCTATVQGTGNFDSTVSWSASFGTIISTGKTSASITAPTNSTATISISAVSLANSTKSGKTSLNVVPPPPSAAFQVAAPGGGNFFSVVMDPRSSQKMYASALQSGLYATIDGGNTWKSIGGNLPADSRSGVVLAVSSQSGTVYAGTSSGIFKSTDSGQSWTGVSSLPAPSSNVASAITPDVLNDALLYATDNNGAVFRSQDSGNSWSTLTLPTTCGGTLTSDIAQSGKLYLGTCSGFYVSTNSGASWSLVSNTGINIGAVVQAKSLLQRMYALVPAAFPLVNLYISSDAGVTWTQILQGDAMSSIVVDSANADRVTALTAAAFPSSGTVHGILRTVNAGLTWSELGKPVLTPDYTTHPYLSGSGPLFLVSSSPEIFFSQTANHLWRIENGGATWIEADQGLTGNFGLQLAVDSTTPSTVYMSGVNGAGINKSLDRGGTWTNLFSASAEAIAIDPFNSQHLLASFILTDPLGAANSPLQESLDGGSTWHDAPAPATQGLPPTSIVFDPNTQGTIYLAFPWFPANLGVAKSIDGGASWNFINNGLTSSALLIQSLAVDPIHLSVVMAGTDRGLYKSADGGATWTLKSNVDIPFSIVFDSNHSGFVYASGQVLQRSVDNGETWAAVNVGRSDLVPPLTLAIDPKAPDTLFLIPFGGPAVGWTPDAGITWFWLPNNTGHFLGGNLSLAAVAKTTPETLYIPSPTGGVVSLTLQH